MQSFKNPWLWACALVWMGLLAPACGEDDNNKPPEFVGVPSEQRVQANEELRFDVVAQDPDGDEVSLELQSGPQGSDFVVSGFGRFFWTPSPADAEVGGKRHDAIFVATDGKGGRSTFRTSIVVTPSLSDARFTTSNNRVLDLSRDQTLKARVAVQADDVTQVPMTLAPGAPANMELSQDSPKSAVLVWTPTAAQVSEKLIWGVTVQADTGGDEPFTQDITVTLIAKNCVDGNTSVNHVPLSDQRGIEDYAIEAQVSDPSAEVTLFWRLGGDPGDSGGFEGVAMVNGGGGSTFTAIVPNPRVNGQPVDLYYFIVAYTSAERDTGCAARSPEKGLHSFAAFSAGDESCRTDAFEPNDDPQNAPVIDESVEGVIDFDGFYEVYGLALCQGDTDVFAVELEAGEGVSVLATYPGTEGTLHLRGIGPDGSTVITESDDAIQGESAMVLPAAQSGVFYVEVSGAPQGYQLFLGLRDDVDPECIDNTLEPNESDTGAPNLPAGTYDNLRICPGDRDYFGVIIPQGYALTARATFSHAQGDLDLALTDASRQTVARAFSSSDNEELVYFNNTNSQSFVLNVRPFDDQTSVPYRLELIIEEAEVEPCNPDFFEPNNSAQEVQSFALNASLEDFGATMCGDDDFYAVDVPAGTELSADIAFDQGVADLDLEILDLDLRVVDSSTGAGGSEQVSFTTLRDGLHYVRVFRNGISGVPEYSLNISFGGGDTPQGECAELDLNEPNNDRNQAATAPIDDSIENIGLCSGDEDWYFFQVSPNQTILANVEAIAIGDSGDPVADILVELINLDGSVLAEGIEFNGTLDLQANIPNSEPHFIRVSHTGGANEGFLYDLEMIVF